jgi:hypothetical protein
MSQTLVIKFSRLLLALSVSVWMAGGCLFGCSGGQVMAAEVSQEETAVSGDSCNKARQHDCCTRPNAQKLPRPKTKKQVARHASATHTGTGLALSTGPSALNAPPRSMQDCPLMTNATAVTAKNNGNLPDPGHTSVAMLPAIKNTSKQTEFTPVQSYIPNRGPTHLRCCVFLI